VSTPNRRSAGHDNAQQTQRRAAKPAATPAADKVTYTATGRSGVVRRSTSATRLTHAVDVKIAGRKGAQFAAGVVVAFYASKDKAQAAADSINAGAAGDDWTDAVVVAR
jgi:hypothetical protein